MKNKLGIWMIFTVITGCGGASSEGTTATSNPEETGTNSQLASEAVWDDLDFNGKQAFMAGVVIPEMKPLFIEHHPDFACQTCHGSNAPEVNFKMPNTLDPLDPANMPFNSSDEKLRATAAFMKDTVVPKMAGLLKESPYNPETGEGFGCFNCHAKK